MNGNKNIIVTLAALRLMCHAASELTPTVETTITTSTTSSTRIDAPVAHPCPDDMVLIDAIYCPNVEEACLRWVDAEGKTIGPPTDGFGRCGEFRYPTRCLTPADQRVHKKYCIDRYEYPDIPNQKPQSWMSWLASKTALEASGKRLCTDSEWTLACEGRDVKPYPYGDGYHRDRTACNFDNDMSRVDVFKDNQTVRAMDDILVASGTMPRCVSPFGVYDMVGNLDEFVVNESGHPHSSGFKGGHVFGVRNACRPMTVSHDERFAWYESGTRGCKDVIP